MSETEAKVREILASQLFIEDEDKITLDTLILADPENKKADSLGADSLDLVEVLFAFEQEFDISIDDTDVKNLKTIRDVVNYIDEKL